MSASATLSFNTEALLAAFPPVHYAMAYGSGVLRQANAPLATPPMVDFVFAVDDPRAWHADNLRRNRAHYPHFAAAAGPALIAGVQESAFGARVWYNALVPVPEAALLPPPPPQQQQQQQQERGAAPPLPRLMKYGVISTRALLEDLRHWSTLYVAGRLHKPVQALAPCSSASDGAASSALRAALHGNLRSALCAALLLLPARFSPLQLFSAVAGLSYTGDWRMLFGEDPHKVRNIVQGSLAAFRSLYAPVLAEAPFSSLVSLGSAGSQGEGEIECDTSPAARVALGLALPLAVQRRMAGLAQGSAWALGARGALLRSPTAAALLASAPCSHGSSSSGSGGASSSARRTALREPAVMSLWEGAMAVGGEQLPRERLQAALVGIVAPSARGQSLKGILTAGPVKSAAYAAAKIAKSVRGFIRG